MAAMMTLNLADCINQTCPWSGKAVQADSLTLFQGQVVGFCNPGCRDKFVAAIQHFEAAAQTLHSASKLTT
jgi:hypothetical protein